MRHSEHGGDIYRTTKELDKNINEIIDFSANINPFGIPVRVKEAIKEAVEQCIHYPDPYCRALTKKLAEYHNLSQEMILCGNGAADLIFRVAYAVSPKKGLVLAPTFSEYEAALKSVGADVSYYTLQVETKFDVTEEILEHLDESLDIVFICNPNNPTGKIIEKALLIKIIEKCKTLDLLCIVDECFNDFLVEGECYSVVDVLGDYPNLIVLKAFTKMYALAGVRLGYVVSSNTELLDKMYHVGQCWAVSTLAQVAGCMALEEVAYVNKTVNFVALERQKMMRKLNEMGYTVFDSKANYIFFYTADTALGEKLYQEGIMIRSCDNYKGLKKGYYRIAVKNTQQNEILMEAIERITKQWQNHL